MPMKESKVKKAAAKNAPAKTRSHTLVMMKRNYQLYLFLVPGLILLLLFSYFPMYGILIAFKDFRPVDGIWGSQWVGLKYFERFFSMPMCGVIIKNTVVLSLYTLVAGFPLPILLALVLNSSPCTRLKKVVQTVTYAPHFISVVIIVAMINIFFSPSTGIIKNLLNMTGLLQGNLETLMDPSSFPHLYVWSGVWASIGWNSIIYLGALAGVDPALHEAATVDGASKFQRVLNVDLPAIIPTIVILLILNSGTLMNVGFEKAFLMQNAFNTSTSEIINTYVYNIGIKEGQYSLSTAIGLFNSVINFALIIIVNRISRKLGQDSLW